MSDYLVTFDFSLLTARVALRGQQHCHHLVAAYEPQRACGIAPSDHCIALGDHWIVPRRTLGRERQLKIMRNNHGIVAVGWGIVATDHGIAAGSYGIAAGSYGIAAGGHGIAAGGYGMGSVPLSTILDCLQQDPRSSLGCEN
jgi:hypothetical protein